MITTGIPSPKREGRNLLTLFQDVRKGEEYADRVNDHVDLASGALYGHCGVE